MKRRFQGLKETPHFVQKSWMNPMHRETLANIGGPIIFVQLYKIINIFPYRHNSVFGVRSQNIEELSEASVAGILGDRGIPAYSCFIGSRVCRRSTCRTRPNTKVVS